LTNVKEPLSTGTLGCRLNPKTRFTKERNIFTFAVEERLEHGVVLSQRKCLLAGSFTGLGRDSHPKRFK
jgi:hypothetical protein